MKKIASGFTIAMVLASSVFPFTAGAQTEPSATAADTTADTTITTQQAASGTFSDVPQTHPNYVAIMYLKSQGILGGYEDGTFKPDALVNRAEALKILMMGNKVEVPETVAQASFSDYQAGDWFAKFVEQAKTLGIVNGNPDGTFAPARNVNRAEFIKMLLILNGLKTEKWVDQVVFADIPKGEWFTPYMNYAGQAGLITKDENNMLHPSRELTRGDVAEIMYLMIVIRSDQNTQFLVTQAEAQMSQIEIYIAGNNILAAKRASELSVDFTQQAYLNMPDNTVVLSAAKLARAYDYLMNSFLTALAQDYVAAKDWAEKAIAKATEAWEVNHDVQPIARHIKDRANEILGQIPAA
jgi:hypothetical protein